MAPLAIRVAPRAMMSRGTSQESVAVLRQVLQNVRRKFPKLWSSTSRDAEVLFSPETDRAFYASSSYKRPGLGPYHMKVGEDILTPRRMPEAEVSVIHEMLHPWAERLPSTRLEQMAADARQKLPLTRLIRLQNDTEMSGRDLLEELSVLLAEENIARRRYRFPSSLVEGPRSRMEGWEVRP